MYITESKKKGVAFLRKYGSNKKNPNPAWPSQNSMVVVPPGSNATAVGMEGQMVYEMTEEELKERNQMSDQSAEMNSEIVEESERELRRDPIMGNLQSGNFRQSGGLSGVRSGNICGNMGVNGYLCGQVGKYVKLEFLFGENTHMEKIGRLREVGKDFVAIQENGTSNIIVCSISKIKFINIYEYGF